MLKVLAVLLGVLLLHDINAEDNSRLEILKVGDGKTVIAFHVRQERCRWASVSSLSGKLSTIW